MRYLLLSLFAVISIHKISVAQSDTSVIYLTELGDTTRQNAVTYTKFFKQDNLWHGREYFIKSSVLKSEGNYLEKNFAHPVGTFRNYSEKGILLNTTTFNDSSNLKERTYFYENGSKKAWVHNGGPGDLEQKCWDSLGNESPFCKVEVAARFKGGMEGWKKFLERNINASVAEESGAPVGSYTVEVQLMVSTNGEVSNVQATTVPADCKPCALEVVRILTKSPPWEPATLNGVPYNYMAKQYITFLVEKTKGRRKS